MTTVSARGLITNFRNEKVAIDEIQHAETFEVTSDGATQTTDQFHEAVEMVADLVHHDGLKMSDDTPRSMIEAVEEQVRDMEQAPAMAM
ncbi:hypothetical protein [Salipiger mucosus]|uniref:Uncharacterized protein n=1 Tax=Salipiger mucosus DSM 16094 TaxID=1123237 RepID=S9S159_9RHOB|nr:hypothetical protein [Salipiger mucosus]EPX83955.1 hypothetical protein Salmuc_01730 [Salipiger mucosus DSM 16094]